MHLQHLVFHTREAEALKATTLPSSSSLLSLVSSIVQSTKLPSSNSILYVPSQMEIKLNQQFKDA
jgi:hypothetical protein